VPIMEWFPLALGAAAKNPAATGGQIHGFAADGTRSRRPSGALW
jgi:hypothetical protein